MCSSIILSNQVTAYENCRKGIIEQKRGTSEIAGENDRMKLKLFFATWCLCGKAFAFDNLRVLCGECFYLFDILESFEIRKESEHSKSRK